MNRFFILMLLSFNLVSLNQAVASTNLDHNVIFNDVTTTDGTKDEETKDEEKNPEDDCE